MNMTNYPLLSVRWIDEPDEIARQQAQFEDHYNQCLDEMSWMWRAPKLLFNLLSHSLTSPAAPPASDLVSENSTVFSSGR